MRAKQQARDTCNQSKHGRWQGVCNVNGFRSIDPKLLREPDHPSQLSVDLLLLDVCGVHGRQSLEQLCLPNRLVARAQADVRILCAVGRQVQVGHVAILLELGVEVFLGRRCGRGGAGGRRDGGKRRAVSVRTSLHPNRAPNARFEWTQSPSHALNQLRVRPFTKHVPNNTACNASDCF
eukprot:2293128-Lingulodinium_polyedra.AAC.1